MFIELPILGDLVAIDQIASVRYLPPSKSNEPVFEVLPRVIVDTRQNFGQHIIECDSVEGAQNVRKTIIDAIRAAETKQ